MCGIAGFVDPKQQVPPHQRKLLAFENSDRGEEGCGVVWLSKKKNKICGWKTDKSIIEAILNDDIPRYAWESKLLLIHCRRASRGNGIGSRSQKNSHPFEHEGVIAAHNGHIENWRGILSDEKESIMPYDVDSQVIPLLISRHGEREALAKLRGTAAIWWIDANKGEEVGLWVWRQELAAAQYKDLFVFSSENKHLRVAGFKSGYTLKSSGQIIHVNLETGVHSRQLPDVPGLAWNAETTKAVEESGTGTTAVTTTSTDPKKEKFSNGMAAIYQLCTGIKSHACSKCKMFLSKGQIYYERGFGVDHHKGCGGLAVYMDINQRKRICAEYWLDLSKDQREALAMTLRKSASFYVSVKEVEEKAMEIAKRLHTGDGRNGDANTEIPPARVVDADMISEEEWKKQFGGYE